MPRSTFGRLIEWSVYSVMGCAIFCGCWAAWRAHAYDTCLQQLAAQGHPISLAHLQTDEDKGSQEDGWQQLQALRGPLEQYNMTLFRFSDSFVVDEVAPETLALHAQLSEQFPELDTQLRTAISADTWGYSMDDAETELIESTKLLKSAAWMLVFHGRCLQARGDREGSHDNCLQLLRLGDRAGKLPTVVNFLSGQSVRSMALQHTAEWLGTFEATPEQIEVLSKQLEQASAMDDLKLALETERAFAIDSLPISGAIVAGKKLLQYFEHEIANCEFESHERKPYELGFAEAPWISEIYPALNTARQAADRLVSQTRGLQILLAVESRQANDPDWALTQQNLERLIEQDLAEDDTMDTVSGKTLVVQVTAEKVLVYSIGPNKKDDQGHPALDFTIAMPRK